jgi:hypothetical protein
MHSSASVLLGNNAGNCFPKVLSVGYCGQVVVIVFKWFKIRRYPGDFQFQKTKVDSMGQTRRAGLYVVYVMECSGLGGFFLNTVMDLASCSVKVADFLFS